MARFDDDDEDEDDAPHKPMKKRRFEPTPGSRVFVSASEDEELAGWSDRIFVATIGGFHWCVEGGPLDNEQYFEKGSGTVTIFPWKLIKEYRLDPISEDEIDYLGPGYYKVVTVSGKEVYGIFTRYGGTDYLQFKGDNGEAYSTSRIHSATLLYAKPVE